MENIDINFSYCYSCKNRIDCHKYNWVITMDKDGRTCDNYKVRDDLKALMGGTD